MTRKPRWGSHLILCGALAFGCVLPASARASDSPPVPIALDPVPTYADLVDLARESQVVAQVTVTEQIPVPAARAPGLAAGKVRLYLQASTQAVIGGSSGLGASVQFLADVPADARGKAPKLKKMTYIVFARKVAGRPGELQLVGSEAMQPDTPAFEQRVRTVLTQLANSHYPHITGVRQVMSIPGNLVGESETQIFLSTQSGKPVSLDVERRPEMAPRWGVSWTDIIDQSARPPRPDTIEWYTLACSLPARLPDHSFIQNDPQSRRQARADYQLILKQLGPCKHNS